MGYRPVPLVMTQEGGEPRSLLASWKPFFSLGSNPNFISMAAMALIGGDPGDCFAYVLPVESESVPGTRGTHLFFEAKFLAELRRSDVSAFTPSRLPDVVFG